MPPIPRDEPEPFWSTSDGRTVRLYRGDTREVLRGLPEKSVHCCVTSPPYWGLRDYGTATWEGGDPECQHRGRETDKRTTKTQSAAVAGYDGVYSRRNTRTGDGSDRPHVGNCVECGAKRIDMQIGSEPSPDCGTQGQVQCGACFVCSMVSVFREVKRVLRDDGVLWLNLGDSYAGSSSTGGTGSLEGSPRREARMFDRQNNRKDGSINGPSRFELDGTPKISLSPGNLVGVPWRVALALQADGWMLRQDVIWAKPSPMPESVRNRCTKAHEYVFMLTKSMRYFSDFVAIRERSTFKEGTVPNSPFTVKNAEGTGRYDSNAGKPVVENGYSNKRSVWRVSSKGYEGAHFATFPPALIEPTVLASTSAYGCCSECGAPWRRVVEETQLTRERPNDYVKRTGEDGTGSSCANSVDGVDVRTTGWTPTCTCNGKFVKKKAKKLKGSPKASGRKTTDDDLIDSDIRSRDGKSWADWQSAPHGEDDFTEVNVNAYESDLPLEDHPTEPCTVLDPFVGSGTTCGVAIDHGLYSIGIDLSEEYLRNNAVPRIEGELLSRPDMAGLVTRVRKRVEFGERA